MLDSNYKSDTYTTLSLARTIFIIFLIWSAFYAPLKWVLNLVGLGFLFYIPKIALIFSMCLSVISTKQLNKTFVVFMCFIVCSSAYGMYIFGGGEQVLFGIYILVPLIFGVFYGETLFSETVKKNIFYIWVIICIGVFINIFIQYPWAGSVASVDGKDIYISKEWSTYGVTRYAGFSVASYSVATQLLALSVYLVSISNNKRTQVLISVISLFFLILTTTKGAIFSVLVVSLIVLFYKNKKAFLYPTLIFTLLLGIILPILSLSYADNLVYNGSAANGSWLFTTETIYERMTWMWPESLSFILDKGNYILGSGMGGIGTALSFFYNNFDENALRFASADSLFIYTFGLFGVFGMYIVFSMCRRAANINWNDSNSIYLYMSMLSILLYGLVGAPYEREFWIVFVGVTIRLAYKTSNATE